MYPETDVPPIRIRADRQAQVLSNLPELPEVAIARLSRSLSQDLATQIVDQELETDWHSCVGGGIPETPAASLLVQQLSGAAHRQVVIDRAAELGAAVKSGAIPLAGLEPLVAAMLESPEQPIEALIEAAGVGAVDETVVDQIIAELVESRLEFVKEKGLAAVGPLMGPAMQELRGKIDGKVLSAKLQAAIKAHL